VSLSCDLSLDSDAETDQVMPPSLLSDGVTDSSG
jgi:hypothetical protein